MTVIDCNAYVKRLTSLAEGIGDLIFELENNKQVTEKQAELISAKLDKIFAKHLQQRVEPHKGT